MTPEGQIVQYLRRRISALGGLARKAHWEGHVGAPDQFIMLPANALRGPVQLWVEVKAPGKEPQPHQIREHTRMREFGCKVYIVDSDFSVDQLLASYGA